ncbi:hypothetical protein HAALTHF_00040n [Vreelandella aquamarina]|nr:hypothetical protein HAALTHF_00040n [Halomonas axialensis]
MAYFEQHQDVLDEDSKRRLTSNPLRILDSKNPDMAEMLNAAPQLMDHLDDESRAHFEQLKAMLDAAGIPYVVNPRLVRGLDYCRTVFEWTTTALAARAPSVPVAATMVWSSSSVVSPRPRWALPWVLSA